MKVELAWELHRIVLVLDCTHLVLYEAPDFTSFTHGAVQQGSLDLTYEETKILVRELQCALNTWQELDTMLDTLVDSEEQYHESNLP
jgi:deoxyinosine 3'endonuclease (endonuclease V)